MEIRIIRNQNPAPKPEDESKLGFGKIFTDHMFTMDWDAGIGWHDPQIVPFAPLAIHPGSTVLHYGLEVFEGLKAYRTADGEIRMFRPEENAARINRSAERLAMPAIDEAFFVKALEAYVDVERDWVPHGFGTSLYLRPFMFGDSPDLGVHQPPHMRFLVIASPSGSYYAEGINPVSIVIEDEDVRAVRGGTGYTKCGGNYAASLRAGERAESAGYSQVLWLDGVERRYIEEVGSMNIMFKIGGVIVTPELNGSILPGITRKSILEMLRAQGTEVQERRISVDELLAAAESGELEEAWGCGTAAVVSPVGVLSFRGTDYTINGGRIGPVTQKIYDIITGVQWGKTADPFGWIYPVHEITRGKEMISCKK